MKRIKIFAQIIFLGVAFVIFATILPRLIPSGNSTNYPGVPILSLTTQANPISNPSVTSTPQSPYPPPIQFTSTPIATKITFPVCKFPTKTTLDEVSTSNLDQFIFSEPQIVMTTESNIGIFGWQPNNEGLVISKRKLKDGLSTIELFNMTEKTSRVFGEGFDYMGFNAFGSAAWIDSYQAIAYIHPAGNNNAVLRITKGDKQDIITPVELYGTNFALDNDGKLLYFPNLTPTQLLAFDIQQKQIDPAYRDLSLPSQTTNSYDFWEKYQVSPRPGEHQWVIFNNTGAYLVDPQSKQICEVYFGSSGNRKLWAFQTQWSPDGRFLAAFVAIGQPIVPFIDLMVIDTWSGDIWRLDIGAAKPMLAMSWSPNSRNFVVIAGISKQEENAVKYQEIYLGDAFTKKSKQMLNGYPFSQGTAYSGISWSPNGKIIALNCKKSPPGTNEAQSQLCLINTEGGQ